MSEKAIDKDMFQDFDIEAIWSLDKKFSSYSYGSLTYRTNDNCTINIYPAFCNEIDQFNSAVKKYNIYGYCKHGEIIQGVGYGVGNEFNRSGLSSEEIQLFDFSIKNFRNDNDFHPKFVKFSATDFDYWLPNQSLKIPKNGLGMTIDTPKSVNIGNVQYNNAEYTLKIGYSDQTKNQNNNHVFLMKMNNFLMLESSSKLDQNETIELIQKLISLYEIIAEPASLKKVSYEEGKNRKNVFLNPRYKNFMDNKWKPNLFFLNYADVKSDINKIINNWLNSSKELQMLAEDYLLTVNYNSVIENDLINYTQGIESFYRHESGATHLKDKIELFISELPEIYQTLLSDSVGDIESWVASLVNTRVFITHGDREGKAISSPFELVKVTKILGFMIRIFILEKIGTNIDIDKLKAKFKDVLNPRYY